MKEVRGRGRGFHLSQKVKGEEEKMEAVGPHAAGTLSLSREVSVGLWSQAMSQSPGGNVLTCLVKDGELVHI